MMAISSFCFNVYKKLKNKFNDNIQEYSSSSQLLNSISLAYFVFHEIDKIIFHLFINIWLPSFSFVSQHLFCFQVFFHSMNGRFYFDSPMQWKRSSNWIFFLSYIQMGKNITNPTILNKWSSFFHTIFHLGNTHHYLTRN